MRTIGTEPSNTEDKMREYLVNFEQLPFGVATLKNDPYSTLIQANPSFYNMIGYTKDQFQEKLENRMSDILIDYWYDAVAAQPTGEDYDIKWNLRIRKADGTIAWVHDHSHYHAASDTFFVVFTDITDSMISETTELSRDAFLVKNEILRYSSRYTTKFIVVSDLETDKVVYLSDAVMELYGFQQEKDWQGKTYKEIGFGAEENVRLSFYEPLYEDRFTTCEYYNTYHKLYSKVETKIITIPVINRKLRLSIITDITAQKKLEHRMAFRTTLYNCVESLFAVGATDQDAENAYFQVLSQLRAYYYADEAFFYKFAEQENKVESLYRVLPNGEKIYKPDFNLNVSAEQLQLLKEISSTTASQQKSVLEKFGMDYQVTLAQLRFDYQVHGFSCVTLTNAQGNIVAFMGVINPQNNEEDKDLMTLLSRSICMFIDHAQNDAAREEALKLEAVSKTKLASQCAKNFKNISNSEENMVHTLDSLCHHYDADFAFVLLQQKDGTCHIPYAGGNNIPELTAFQKQSDTILKNWTNTFESQPLFASSVDFEELNTPDAQKKLGENFGIHNFLVAPMQDAAGNLMGLLFINNFKHLNYSRLPVNTIAKYISDYLERIHLQKKIHLEPVTKLTNKVATEAQIATALEQGNDGTLFIIDIDNFKELNDTLGHPVGDQAILDIAENLKKISRTTDITGRVGGDEFMVFCHGLSTKSSIETKSQQILENCRLTYEADGLAVSISASIGVCAATDHYNTYGTLYAKADYALYGAKKLGKNQYCIYTPTESDLEQFCQCGQNSADIAGMTPETANAQMDTLSKKFEAYLATSAFLPYGVAIVKNDPFSTLLQANPAYYKMIGYTKEELLEKHENRVSEILVDNIYYLLEQHSMVEDFDIEFDLRIRNADGTIRWIHDFAHYDVALDVFFITVTDITDKIVAETVDLSFEAFQARNQILAYVSKYTSEHLILADAITDKIVYMNPSVMQMLKFHKESDWSGKTYTEIIFGSPENIPEDYYERTKEDSYVIESFYNTYYKRYARTEVKTITIPALNQKFRLYIITDITAQKQLEHKIVMQNVLHNCMETLFAVEVADKSTDEAYYDILNQLKAYYQSDITFFYKFKNGTNDVENIYEVFAEGVEPSKHTFPITVPEQHMEVLKKLSSAQIDEYQSLVSGFDSHDTVSLKELHARHNVVDFSCVSVYDKKGRIAACMGVTNPKTHGNDKELMEVLSRFICMFLDHEQDQSIKEEAVALETASRVNVTNVCMKNAQNLTNPIESITNILDAMCQHYDADFAVTLLNQANGVCATSYVGGPHIPDLDGFDNQPRHIMEKWIEIFEKYPKTVSDSELVDPVAIMVKQILLEKYGIYNYIVSPIKNTNGTAIGLLFLSNFRLANRSHLLVHMVAESLSHYIGKLQLYEATQLGLLTRLASKTTAQNQIAKLLEKEQNGALFLIDMDNFKQLNDIFGHHIGDQAIVDLVDTLKKIFGPTDIISRIGGDEFMVFTPGRIAYETIVTQAKQILNQCYHRYEKDETAVTIGTSIGISLVNEKCKTFQPLYENTDYALYVAKKNGKHRYQIYSEMEYQEDTTVADEMRFYPNVVEKLQTAIHNRNFVVHYQPIYHVPTGTYTQAEALVRIAKPDGSLIYPSDFIHVAEKSGLVVEMTYQMLEQVCQDFSTLLKEQPNTTLTSIAINVPYLQFTDPDMERRFIEILKKYHISPNQIKLEITERSIVSDMDLVLRKMASLKAFGFEFELDDFGTDYSNLQMCITLPLEVIKLDRSLLLAAFASDRSRRFFEHTMAGIHDTAGTIILEGVETQEQLDWAIGCHCEHIQGYYFSKPLGFAQFKKMLQAP